ncbi:MAG: 30S ribosome-binding factor RbfA [Planctomycetota bacterium]
MANPRTIARLAARIHERAAHCLQFEVADPRASFITITKVELSEDLSVGKIYYSVLGSAADKSKAEHMLKSAAGFIQRQVSGVLSMRRMPNLRWYYDESMERAADMDQLIRKARERDRAINPSLPEVDAIETAPAAPPAFGGGLDDEDADEDDEGELGEALDDDEDESGESDREPR